MLLRYSIAGLLFFNNLINLMQLKLIANYLENWSITLKLVTA